MFLFYFCERFSTINDLSSNKSQFEKGKTKKTNFTFYSNTHHSLLTLIELFRKRVKITPNSCRKFKKSVSYAHQLRSLTYSTQLKKKCMKIEN